RVQRRSPSPNKETLQRNVKKGGSGHHRADPCALRRACQIDDSDKLRVDCTGMELLDHPTTIKCLSGQTEGLRDRPLVGGSPTRKREPLLRRENELSSVSKGRGEGSEKGSGRAQKQRRAHSMIPCIKHSQTRRAPYTEPR